MEERNPGQKSVFLPFYRPLLRLRQSHFFHHLTRKGEDGRASLEAEKQPQQKGKKSKKKGGGSESTAFLKGPAGRRHSLFCAGGEAVFGWQLPTFALSGRKKKVGRNLPLPLLLALMNGHAVAKENFRLADRDSDSD